MRTTMKRGYGRAVGAAADGNGGGGGFTRGKTAMTRYRQPEPEGRGALRTAGAILGWFVICIMVLSVGLGGGVYLWAHESVSAAQAHTPEFRASIPQLKGVHDPKKPAIALVLG